MSQKIAIFSLSTPTPRYMTAVYQDNNLVMTEPKSLPGSLKKQRELMIPAIEKLRAGGFKVLVDEVSSTLAAATGANHISLKARHNDGRAVLIVGIERFNELQLQKAIVLPQKNPGAYEIPSSIVDIDYNANGEAVYRVNWSQLRTEHVLTILCCYATVYHAVASADYIAAMTGATGEERQPNIFMRTFSALVRHQSVENDKTASKSSLTGKRLSDNEVIL